MSEIDVNKLPYRPNVGLVVMNSDGYVFTGQRLDFPGAAWQMPQGGIDEGEDPREAAFRELREETGIEPELTEVLAEASDWFSYEFPEDLIPKLWHGGYRGQKQMWYLLRFIGRDDQINIKTEEPEFSAWKWMPPEDLLENIVPFKREIYEKVLIEFQDYLG